MYNYSYLMLSANKENTKYYSRCQAHPAVRLAKYDRDEEEVKQLVEHLCKVTGEPEFNHSFFAIQISEYPIIVEVSDSIVYIGVGVEKGW